jgi:tetratricopeptide (TPR) repeat protein
VAELCARLEGLPLALELAAARLGALTPAQMLAQFSDRCGALRVGGLRDTIAWSWQLLPDDARRCFSRLSVFEGGWTLEAAAAVVGAEVADTLSLLHDSSLILCREADGHVRFRMLDALAEFAGEKLGPEASAAARAAHAAYYLALAESVSARARRPGRERFLASLDEEQANLRAALRELLARDPAAAARLAAALTLFWRLRGRLQEGREWLIRVMASAAPAGPDAGESAPGRLLLRLGCLAWEQGDLPGAEECCEAARQQLESSGDRSGEATALHELGLVLTDRGDYSGAADMLRRAIRQWRVLGDRFGLALSLKALGSAECARGNQVAAESLCREALAIVDEDRDWYGYGYAREALASALLRQNRTAEAVAHLRGCLRLYRQIRHPVAEANVLLALGALELDRCNDAAAAPLLSEALTLFRCAGDRRGLTRTLEACARMAAARGDLVSGRRCLGTARAERAALGLPVPPVEQDAYANLVHRLEHGNELLLAEPLPAPLREAIAAALAVMRGTNVPVPGEDERESPAPASAARGRTATQS